MMASETDNINKIGKGTWAFGGGSSFRKGGPGKALQRSEIVMRVKAKTDSD